MNRASSSERVAVTGGHAKLLGEIRFICMRKYIYLLIGMALFAACEQKETTVTNPPAEKKESNTTVINPPAEKKESNTTVVNPATETKKEKTEVNINTSPSP